MMALLDFCAMAAPFRFGEASLDVQDYVVIEVTNRLSRSTIALVKGPVDNVKDKRGSLIPYFFCCEMGLKEIRCIEVLKGDVSSGGDKKCYFYETPRYAHELPRVGFVMTDGQTVELRSEGYFKGDKIDMRNWVWLEGRNRWMHYPPYDPYQASNGRRTDRELTCALHPCAHMV